jgi:IS5 family transposase
MRGRAGFFDIDERLEDLSAKGDDLERLKGLIDVAMLRPASNRRCRGRNSGTGGRRPF